jgi:hypothetical protein
LPRHSPFVPKRWYVFSTHGTSSGANANHSSSSRWASVADGLWASSAATFPALAAHDDRGRRPASSRCASVPAGRRSPSAGAAAVEQSRHSLTVGMGLHPLEVGSLTCGPERSADIGTVPPPAKAVGKDRPVEATAAHAKAQGLLDRFEHLSGSLGLRSPPALDPPTATRVVPVAEAGDEGAPPSRRSTRRAHPVRVASSCDLRRQCSQSRTS